jgi:hypothetical protein
MIHRGSKKWYKRMNFRLTSVTMELRSFNFQKKLSDEFASNFRRDLEITIFFGSRKNNVNSN